MTPSGKQGVHNEGPSTRTTRSRKEGTTVTTSNISLAKTADYTKSLLLTDSYKYKSHTHTHL